MLGMAAIGITDRNSLAGVVRAWTQMRSMAETPFAVKALTGCRLDFADGTPSLLCYPSDREAYGRLTRLLTLGQLRAGKGARPARPWSRRARCSTTTPAGGPCRTS